MVSESAKCRQQAILRQLRRDLGGSKLYTHEFVLRRCELAYGREISARLWRKWRESVGVEADSRLGGMVGEATYILLLTKAGLLRGNRYRGAEKKQVPVERLAEAVRAITSGDRPWDVPAVISYGDLKRLIELRALRTYTDRYLRNHGLKRSQQLYPKAQAVQILSNFPDYSYVFKTHETSTPVRQLA
jgi:hypothetical protein